MNDGNSQIYLFKYSGCIFFLLGLAMIITYFTIAEFQPQMLTVSIIMLSTGILLFTLCYCIGVNKRKKPIIIYDHIYEPN
jgi:uncharacterized membrane protein